MFKYLIFGGVLIAVTLLVSCKDDKEKPSTDPSLSIEVEDFGSSLKVLDSLSFSLSADIPLGVLEANATVWLDGNVLNTVYSSEKDSLLTSISERFSVFMEPTYSGSNLSITFSLVDSDGFLIGDTVALSIEESVISVIENRTIAGFGNSQRGSFYDILQDTIYLSNSLLNSTKLKQSIDLLYFYTDDNQGYLASPVNELAETSWKEQIDQFWPLFGAENATKLHSLSSVNYDEVVTGEQISSIVSSAGGGSSSIAGLSVDQILGFTLVSRRDSLMGLIRITDIQGSTTSGATITFNAKIQK